MVAKRQPAPRNASRFTSKVNPAQQPQPQLSPAYLQQLQALLAAQHLANQAPNPSTGRRTKRGPVVAGLPVLPQLGNPGAHQVVPGQVIDQAPRPRDEAAAALRAIRAAAWRHRWQLTPAAATVTTIGAAAAPGPATIGMTVAAALALLAAHKGPEVIGGRTWLSKAERHIATRWLGSAAGWTTGVWVADSAGMHWTGATLGFATAALAAVTGPATLAWLKSRKIRNTDDQAEELSDQAKALLAAWPHTIGGTAGPKQLQGSRIAASTLREPAPGTIAFALDLADGVHAEDATGGELRKHLERALRMGIGTVDLDLNREDSGQILVTLTPARHLEKVAAVWDGPVLTESGAIPLAVTADQREISVALFNESGVEHGMIVGTSNTGKSFTLAAQVLPGVVEGLEVVFYIDGGMGTSAAHLAGACDWWAVQGKEEWEKVIDTAHAVMRSRKGRRSAEKVSKWRGRAETDPVLTLVIDEATTAKGELSDKHQGKVMEMLREGRKLGVRVVQVTQDPMGDDLIGGRKARGLMAGAGTMIGHRPGEGTAAMLTGSSTAESIDLRRLPPEPGWCGIIRRGQVLAKAARVKYATEEKVQEVLAPITLRTLTGKDLAAAGSLYASRVRGQHAAGTHDSTTESATEVTPAESTSTAQPTSQPGTLSSSKSPTSPAAPGQPAAKDKRINAVTNSVARFRQAQRETNAIAIVSELRVAGAAGVSTAELVDRLGLPKATINRHLRALIDEGQAARGDDGRARLLEDAA